MNETKKAPNEIVRLAAILFAFAAVTALLLGLVNGITAPRIAEISAENTRLAMNAVLPYDGDYVPVEYPGDDGTVTGVYQAGDEGYVVQLNVSGSQGMIEMVVGVKTDGTVSGVGITGHAETPGLGAIAAASTDAGVAFREQFVGTTGNLTVNKDGGTIDAITGSTVTSRAVTNGVNSAVEAAALLID